MKDEEIINEGYFDFDPDHMVTVACPYPLLSENAKLYAKGWDAGRKNYAKLRNLTLNSGSNMKKLFINEQEAKVGMTLWAVGGEAWSLHEINPPKGGKGEGSIKVRTHRNELREFLPSAFGGEWRDES